MKILEERLIFSNRQLGTSGGALTDATSSSLMYVCHPSLCMSSRLFFSDDCRGVAVRESVYYFALYIHCVLFCPVHTLCCKD